MSNNSSLNNAHIALHLGQFSVAEFATANKTLGAPFSGIIALHFHSNFFHLFIVFKNLQLYHTYCFAYVNFPVVSN